MTRLIVGPFNRVEGDLEVRLEIAHGVVSSAEVVSPLYRGFEQILAGKSLADALVFAPRICGICSVSQSVSAAYALQEVQGLTMAPSGQIAINLIHATENIADHLTHFYLFFMPDFVRPTYHTMPWYEDAVTRFTPIKGSAGQDMLPARAEFLNIMGLLAGKWPHTLGIRPGGSTRAITDAEKARLYSLVKGFRRFLERHLYGDTLEAVAALHSFADLQRWVEQRGPSRADFGMFLKMAETLHLADLGQAGQLFMSYGAYRQQEGHHLPQGVFDTATGQLTALNTEHIVEDTASSWYEAQGERHPYDGRTLPGSGLGPGYSWCKAPRYEGKVIEVGALARQLVAGHPLLLDMVRGSRGSVLSRVVARLLELAATIQAMEGWLEMLDPTAPFLVHGKDPLLGRGFGLTEAARGALGHWLVVDHGKIGNYQIIAPTTWNFSPRDHLGQPGALEQALVEAPIRDGETTPVSVQHIVRSFDPCMVCTVH